MGIPNYASRVGECRNFYQFCSYLHGFNESSYKDSGDPVTPVVTPDRICMNWLGHTTVAWVDFSRSRDTISFEGAVSLSAIQARFTGILNRNIQNGDTLHREGKQAFQNAVAGMESLAKAKDAYLAKTSRLFRLMVRIRDLVMGCFQPFNLNQLKERGSLKEVVSANLPQLVSLEKALAEVTDGESDSKRDREAGDRSADLKVSAELMEVVYAIQEGMRAESMSELGRILNEVRSNPSLYFYLANCMCKIWNYDTQFDVILETTWPEKMPPQGYGRMPLIQLQLVKMIQAFQKSLESDQIKAFFEQAFAKNRPEIQRALLATLETSSLTPHQLRLLASALSPEIADQIEMQHVAQLGITKTTSRTWVLVDARWQRATTTVAAAALAS